MIDACAGLGGVIGVNGVSVFMPGGEAEADAMIRVIDYLAERVGTRHVGIGLDYVYDLELEGAAGKERTPPTGFRLSTDTTKTHSRASILSRRKQPAA